MRTVRADRADVAVVDVLDGDLAAAEEGVAADQDAPRRRRHQVGDVVEGMAGGLDHLDRDRAERNGLPAATTVSIGQAR